MWLTQVRRRLGRGAAQPAARSLQRQHGPCRSGGAGGLNRTDRSARSRRRRGGERDHLGDLHHRHHLKRGDQRAAGGQVRTRRSERHPPERFAGSRPRHHHCAARAGPERHLEPVELLHPWYRHPIRVPGRRRGLRHDAPRRSQRWKAPPAERWSTMATAPTSTPSRPTSPMLPASTYNAALTHRVGFEIRGLAQANNASYTFQPSTGATTGIFMREIVETATCDNCHTFLNAHGGARVEVQYCVMCHTPANTDPYSGNTLDMKQMVHKIHTGNTLPSIQTATVPNTTPTLGQGYWIVGYMESLSNFNTVLYPQDTRNCTTCHAQNIPAATQATNYYMVPTAEACGACHDNVNFATGANHSTAHRRQRLAVHHLPRPDVEHRQWLAAGHRRAHHSGERAGGQVPVHRQQRQLHDQRRQHLSGGEFLGRRSDQQQRAVQHSHRRAVRRHRSGHRRSRLRRGYRAPRDRHRLGHERLHQLGQRRDAGGGHLGPADFLEPALRLRHCDPRPGTDGAGRIGRLYHDLAHSAAGCRPPPTVRRRAARRARPLPTSASSSKDTRASS